MRFLISISIIIGLCFIGHPAAPQNFEALTLQDAVDTALQLNRELGAARYDQAAARSAIQEARSPFFPKISYKSDVIHTESEVFEFDSSSVDPAFGNLFDFSNLGFDGTNFSNTFQFSQLIFDRSVIGGLKLAHLQEQAARQQQIGQKQTVVFNTVATYLDVLRAKELLGVQKQRLALAEKQLDTAQSNFDVGLRIKTDVLRAQLTKSSAMRDVVSSEIALEQALVILNEVMGVELSAGHEIKPGFLENYNPPNTIIEHARNTAKMQTVAEARNPSIQVASILVKQRHESVNIARGEFYPRLVAGASWGFKDQESLDFEDEEWSVQAAIEIPIFEGGRKLAKVRRSKEERDAETQRYENTIRAVLSNVEQAALSLQEEYRNLQIALEAETVAEENQSRFLNLYEEGLADSLDVTQALTELVEAQTNVVATRYGYMRLYAQMLFFMGVIPTSESGYASDEWLLIHALDIDALFMDDAE